MLPFQQNSSTSKVEKTHSLRTAASLLWPPIVAIATGGDMNFSIFKPVFVWEVNEAVNN